MPQIEQLGIFGECTTIKTDTPVEVYKKVLNYRNSIAPHLNCSRCVAKCKIHCDDKNKKDGKICNEFEAKK